MVTELFYEELDIPDLTASRIKDLIGKFGIRMIQTHVNRGIYRNGYINTFSA